jgi:predicted DNA-binding transcriptional regulator YafY
MVSFETKCRLSIFFRTQFSYIWRPMALDYFYLERLVDAMRRPEGANMEELKYVAAKYSGKNVSVKSIERHLRQLREKHLMRIDVRRNRYYIEPGDNTNRFLAASTNNQFAEMVQVKGSEVPVFDLGFFQLGQDVHYMKDVVSALKQSRRITMGYKSMINNEIKTRKIEPMFIRWYASQWYLFARDTAYADDKAPRAFRLDGITDVRLDENFVPRPGDAPGVFGRRFIGVSGHDADAQEVVLHVEGPAFRWLQATLNFDQLDLLHAPLPKKDGWHEIRWMVDPNYELMELLSRLIYKFKVVGPESFKKEYKKRLTELLNSVK